MTRPPTLLVVETFDDVKTRIAKMKANCGRLARERPRDYKKHIRDLDAKISREMRCVAANPLYRDDLLTERVSATIRWVASNDEVREMLNLSVDSDEIQRAVKENGGDLIELVPAAMKSWAYALEMPNLDEDTGFTIGAICTHQRAVRLCSLLHAEFCSEIRSKHLVIELDWYGYHFPDLLTDAQSEEFILKNKQRVQGPEENDCDTISNC